MFATSARADLVKLLFVLSVQIMFGLMVNAALTSEFDHLFFETLLAVALTYLAECKLSKLAVLPYVCHVSSPSTRRLLIQKL